MQCTRTHRNMFNGKLAMVRHILVISYKMGDVKHEASKGKWYSAKDYYKIMPKTL